MDKENIKKRLLLLLKVPKPEKVIEEEDELEEGEIREEYDIDIGLKELESISLSSSINRDNIRVCHECSEEFSSEKALGGHMRIHAQQQSNLHNDNDDSKLSLSSSLSTTDDMNMIIQGDVSVASAYFITDLPIPKRKRSWRQHVGSIINSEEEDAAQDDTTPNTVSKRKKMKSMTDLKLGLDDSSTSTSQAHENPAVEGTSTTQPDNKYKCNICKKSFPTHQALGGHKSSHNKFKINIVNAVADKKDDAGNNGSNKNNVKLDENIIGITSGGTHQCTICKKVFQTGQALGGHKRRHWTGPPVDRASPPSNQVISSSEEVSQTAVEGPVRLLNLFDLNEVPQMEDEGGDNGNGYTSSSYNSNIGLLNFL